MDRLTRKWCRSPADEKAAANGCRFDLAAAERVREFFRECLRHSKGADFGGKPFELQPWQWEDWIAPLFGWRRPDGTRRYRKASWWVSKKNGKSTIAAGLILYGLVADGEPGAEVYGAAADRGQASVIFNEVLAMVRQSPPEMRDRLRPMESVKRLTYPEKNSFYQVLSKDSKKTGHGVNAHLVVIDELHVVDRELYDTLRYAMAARRQPLLIEISTAGNDLDSLGYERYTYAKRLLAGEIEDQETLAYIAEADSDEAWEDSAQWKKANPSLGVTISLDSFRADFDEAKNSSPAQQAVFKQLRLNRWQRSLSTWISPERWAGCQSPAVSRDLLKGRRCFGGLDLANTLDLAAFALVFPDGDPPTIAEPSAPAEGDAKPEVRSDEYRRAILGRYSVLCWAWCPEEIAKERERSNRTRFDAWERAGWLKFTQGDSTDYDVIRADIAALLKLYQIASARFDPHNATQLANQLTQDGLEMVAFTQNMASYNEPTALLEGLVKRRTVQHDGNPLLSWALGNVVIVRNGVGDMMPSRKKSTEKIDPAVAVIMALAGAMGDQGGAAPSVTWF